MLFLADFLISCNDFIKKLKTANFSYKSGSLWHFNDFAVYVSTSFPKHESTFCDMFKAYTLLAGGVSKFIFVNSCSLNDILELQSVDTLKIQFVTILFLILFSRSHKCNSQLVALMFLFHYRGLSYTGLNILSQLGFFLQPRSLSSHFSKFVEFMLPEATEVSIFWFDNLSRKIKGIGGGETQDSHTVLGAISLPIESVIFDPQKPAIGDIFTNESLSLLLDSFEGCCSTSTLDIADELWDMDFLTIPLTVEKEISYSFTELNVLPFVCGTPLGTSQIIQYLKSSLEAYSHDTYVFLLLDYDLYWRIHKFIWTDSFSRNSLHTFRERTLLFHAPWHIYKLLADSLWSKFAPLFLADLWLASSDNVKRVPRKPEFKDFMFYFIAVWSIIKDRINNAEEWNCPDSVYGQLVDFCCNEAIPLVLHLGISLETGNLDAFMDCLPAVVCLFQALGNSNYANSTEIMILQHYYWKKTDSPLLAVLKKHFHAFSEQKGELSIRRLMFHVRCSNYAGSNLRSKYRESGAAAAAFDFVGVDGTYKQTDSEQFSWKKRNGIAELEKYL